MASRERQVAFKILLDIEKKGTFSNIAIANALEANKDLNKKFLRALTYGVLEQKLLLDFFIYKLVKDGGKRLKLEERIILRMGLYQLRAMDSVPDYAAIDESVELAKKFARGKGGLVNGVLRSYLRQDESVFFDQASYEKFFDQLNETGPVKLAGEGGEGAGQGKDLSGYFESRDKDVQDLSIRYSCGPDIVSLWIKDMGLDACKRMLEAGNQLAPIVIRTNLAKTSRDRLIGLLEEEGFTAAKGDLSDTALIIEARNHAIEITETEAFKKGLFSVQDEASQWLVSLVNPKPGERILDVCAAPGGKALAVAEKILSKKDGNKDGKKDIIEARDIHSNKLKRIHKEAKRLGLSEMIETRPADARQADEKSVARYDKVIADLPCSGLGVIRRRPELKYKKDRNDFLALAKLQADILNNVSKFVKSGGLLFYSTCTVSSLENESLVQEFLDMNGEFERLWQRQLLPIEEGCDGFFVAALRKVRNA